MGRRTALPDAASVAPSNDRQAPRRAASRRRAEPVNPGAISVAASSGRRVVPRAANLRRATPAGQGAISAVRSNGHRMDLRAASATTGRAMMLLARTAPVPIAHVPMAHVLAARGRRGNAATANHIRPARARTITAAETSRTAAMIARSAVPPTRRAARSGCMACTPSRLRSPTPRVGCVAWC